MRIEPFSREAAQDRSPWVERSGTLGEEPARRQPRKGVRENNLSIPTVDRSSCAEKNTAAWASQTTKVDSIAASLFSAPILRTSMSKAALRGPAPLLFRRPALRASNLTAEVYIGAKEGARRGGYVGPPIPPSKSGLGFKNRRG